MERKILESELLFAHNRGGAPIEIIKKYIESQGESD